MGEPDVTRLLERVNEGDAEARDLLLDVVYDRLRRMAGARMRSQRPGHTLQPTALVHEAWMKLARGSVDWQNRNHFLAVAARAMRQILINHAEKRSAQKRGGGAHRVTFDDLAVHVEAPDVDLLALDRALDELAEVDERLAQVVELRYFAGLSVEETAEVLDVSPATVKRDWAYARAWLLERIEA